MASQARVEFRFYEELNDFLPANRRKRHFWSVISDNATVKHAIEALGVPHTEVDLVLVNGESVGFSQRLKGGDRVSVYPLFECFDISRLRRLQGNPLRRTRFVADAHLGALARYLRMLGFDTLFRNDYQDQELVSISLAERRILLTKDRALLMRKTLLHALYVRAIRPREQLVELLARLDLYHSTKPFTRCMICNAPLQLIDKTAARSRLPLKLGVSHVRFFACDGCGRLYWEGSHFKRMQSFVQSLLSVAGA